MSEWQPIETAPKDGTEVLLCHEEGRVGNWLLRKEGKLSGQWVAGWNGQFWEFSFSMNSGALLGCHLIMWTHPTHWMPLPEPPNTMGTLGEIAEQNKAENASDVV